MFVGSLNMGANIPVFDTGIEKNLAENSAKDTHFLNMLLGNL
jgi:hypothetical protein